jgi:hypothetical protein
LFCGGFACWFKRRQDGPNRDSGQLYSDFIDSIVTELQDLKADAARLGFSVDDVPSLVENAEDSLVKVVDEFYWITITVGHKIPTKDVIERWLEWMP